MHAEGARRHGDLLLRTIGDRLGSYRLRVRQTTNLESRARTDGASLHILEAEDLFYELLDEHNLVRIAQLATIEGYEPDPDPSTRGARLRQVMLTLVKGAGYAAARVSASRGYR